MPMTPTQIEQLKAPLDAKYVKKRQDRGKHSYIEGWHAIDEANRIFGFDGWQRETIELRLVAEKERKIGDAKKDGWGVTYLCKVRVTALGNLVREGTGSGSGIDVDLGLAHESAAKEAETDAMKRALMTFGNPFGLALYDKEQNNVTGETSPPKTDKPQMLSEPQKRPATPEAWTKNFCDTVSVAPTSDDVTKHTAACDPWLKKLPEDLYKQCAEAINRRLAFLSQQPLAAE